MKTSITVDEVNQWQYYNELNPLYLNYICTLNGHYPVQIESGFNYCELGCGVGVTLNGLAELFPKGKFFGIDNNIDYIDSAVALAKEIDGSNIDFKFLDFKELSNAVLPDFDFIILHDIYSWIDKGARQHILDFIVNQLTIAKVNIDDNPESPSKYGVRGIPTLILFKDGEVASTKVGALPKSKLKEWIESVI